MSVGTPPPPELEELRNWKGPDSEPPSARSIETPVFLVLALVCTIVPILTYQALEILVVIPILFGLFGWIGFTVNVGQDRALARVANLQTPSRAAQYVLHRIQGNKINLALPALADHPTARLRNERLAQAWKAFLKDGVWSYSITHVEITAVEKLADDFARVEIRLDLQRGSNLALLFVGLVGYFLLGKKEQKTIEKLAVKRKGRWALVNGLPEDETDEELIFALIGASPDA